MKIAGVDKAVLREMYDIEVDDAVWKEFVSRRNGALLGVDISEELVPDARDRTEVAPELSRSIEATHQLSAFAKA